MKFNKYIFIIVFVALLLGLSILQVKAVDFGLAEPAGTGLGTQDLKVTIVGFINIFLSIVGIIFVLVIIAGGALYMISKDDPEKIVKIKKYFISAIVGLGIILIAFAIVSFVLKSMIAQTGGGDVGFAAGDGVYDSRDTAVINKLITGQPVTCRGANGQAINCYDVYDFDHDGYFTSVDSDTLDRIISHPE
jgi:hypothetical protein